MNISNIGTRYVTKIEYLGPHQIFSTGGDSYSISFSTEDVDENKLFEEKTLEKA